MTIPATIRLGPHHVTVDATPDTGKLLHEENARGDSRPDRLLVRVDPDRPHTAVAETLLHELVHCAWAQTALRVTQDIDEEQAVAALAPLLLGMLRDNPDLVTFLTASDPP